MGFDIFYTVQRGSSGAGGEVTGWAGEQATGYYQRVKRKVCLEFITDCIFDEVDRKQPDGFYGYGLYVGA